VAIFKLEIKNCLAGIEDKDEQQ